MLKLLKLKESSNIKNAWYNPTAKLLTVEFHCDRIYDYFDVPYQTIVDWQKAESVGSFFHHHIKFTYEFQRVEGVKEVTA